MTYEINKANLKSRLLQLFRHMIKNIKFFIQVRPAIILLLAVATIAIIIEYILDYSPATAVALTTQQELQLQAQTASQNSAQQMIKIVDSIGNHLNQSHYALQNGDVQTGILYLSMAEKNLTSLRNGLSNPTFSQTPGTTVTSMPGMPSQSFSSPFSSSQPASSSSQLPPELPPGPPPPPPSGNNTNGTSLISTKQSLPQALSQNNSNSSNVKGLPNSTNLTSIVRNSKENNTNTTFLEPSNMTQSNPAATYGPPIITYKSGSPNQLKLQGTTKAISPATGSGNQTMQPVQNNNNAGFGSIASKPITKEQALKAEQEANIALKAYYEKANQQQVEAKQPPSINATNSSQRQDVPPQEQPLMEQDNSGAEASVPTGIPGIP